MTYLIHLQITELMVRIFLLPPLLQRRVLHGKVRVEIINLILLYCEISITYPFMFYKP